MSVGIDHDTAAFAAQAIRRRWQDVGRVVTLVPHVLSSDGGLGAPILPWAKASALQRPLPDAALRIVAG